MTWQSPCLIEQEGLCVDFVAAAKKSLTPPEGAAAGQGKENQQCDDRSDNCRNDMEATDYRASWPQQLRTQPRADEACDYIAQHTSRNVTANQIAAQPADESADNEHPEQIH